MGLRRTGRFTAVQLLYGIDTCHAFDRAAEQVEATFTSLELKIGNKAEKFARTLCHGVVEHLPELDRMIEGASKNWKLKRMSCIDRNILRLAVFELKTNQGDLPTAVVLNEAIELGKQLGSSDSGAFINGVLSQIVNQLAHR